MKKALSLVLALAMVLSMAVVGFAAKFDEVNFTATITNAEPDSTNTNYEFQVTLSNVGDNVKGFNVIANNTSEWAAAVGTATPINEMLTKWNVSVPVANTTKIYVMVEALDNAGNVLEQGTYVQVYTAPVEPRAEVKAALAQAYNNNLTEAVIDLTNSNDKVLTAADWKYITNSFTDGWTEVSNWGHHYLGMEVKVINGTTIFDLGLVDYTWKTAVDFSTHHGGVSEEDYDLIRKLTGDTKNPLVFGFSGMDCPDLTVDMVIPQQWINYYGHKNLTLFAWQEALTATRDNGPDAGKQITLEDAKVLTKTTLDVNTTVTQRIQFETDYLYKTLVLSANGVKDTNKTDNGGSKNDNKDANPNTGANDIVNVAVVFAVVSLAAAGAFVCKKSK